MKDRRRQLRRDMTPSEKLLWTFLRRKELGTRFLRQYSVDKYVIDFYSPKIKLAIELDGDVHDSTEQKKYDTVRQEYIEKYGIAFFKIQE